MKKKLLTFLLIFTIFAGPCLYAQSEQITIPAFQKGMCFAAWDKKVFSSTSSNESLSRLKEMGVEYIQVNIIAYQDKFNSTKIKKTKFTPSESSVKKLIKEAHRLGLKVMLKPMIDIIDDEKGTYWRADIGFQSDKDWKKWFKEYKKFITPYAKIAKSYNVELFCIGTELSFASQKDHSWRSIIEHVRKIYPGKITYAANWDNYSNIKFWQELDFVGIDAYFPLTHKDNPTVEDIKKGWKKWALEIEEFYLKTKKPILFTEIGYVSSATAPMEPWKNGTGNADMEIQAKCYQAFFETVWKKSWLSGVYWWRWAPSLYAGGKHNRHFTPQNKPAAMVIEAMYTEDIQRQRIGRLSIEDIDLDEQNYQAEIEKNLMKSSESFLSSPINPIMGTLSPTTKTSNDYMMKLKWMNIAIMTKLRNVLVRFLPSLLHTF